jgi:peptidoglycan hydrolase-like protein with peptidoglycan-binding domain
VVVQPNTNTNNEIKDIQTWLNTAYGFKLVVDGKFGMNSMNALTKAVQKEIGVNADGKFGALSKLAAARHNMKQGSKGNLVKLWQGYFWTVSLCKRR